MSTTKQRGFSAVEAIVIVVVVAALGIAGYVVYQRMQSKEAATPSSQDSAVQEAPAVNDTKDLDTAVTALDQTDLDASTSDSTQLDGELSRF